MKRIKGGLTGIVWILLMAAGGYLLLARGQATAKEASATTKPTTQPSKPPTVEQLDAAILRLRPLHKKLQPPKPGDWLFHHRESGQTFRQYLLCKPTLPRGRRNVIHVQPLGEFTDAQRKVVTLAGDFLGRFYSLPVQVQKDLPLSVVPAEARRVHPSWGVKQILTGYVLDEVLKPRLPEDAAVYIAFTSSDLWPGKGWNFVFGQASLRERVGVWSIFRYGDPGKDDEGLRLCLLRTLKTGVHEIGHMFSMQHCTALQCGMCGSYSLLEADRRPLAFCPECMAKVCWATRADPAARYQKLVEFCKRHGLKAEAEFYAKLHKALGGGD